MLQVGETAQLRTTDPQKVRHILREGGAVLGTVMKRFRDSENPGFWR